MKKTVMLCKMNARTLYQLNCSGKTDSLIPLLYEADSSLELSIIDLNA